MSDKRALTNKRYDILCQRLIQEQFYTMASVIISLRSAVTTGEYADISEMPGLKMFVTSLAGHIADETARASSNS